MRMSQNDEHEEMEYPPGTRRNTRSNRSQPPKRYYKVYTSGALSSNTSNQP